MEYELSDIIQDHIKALKMTAHQHKVLTHIMHCRTHYMGGHKLECSNQNCDHTEILYNSCRDRHCPKCQGSNQIKWKNKRIQELLPTTYNHLTFTIPSFLHATWEYNQEECYKLLFSTIREILKCSKYKIGFNQILHTWTQQINYHPHIHCVIPDIKIKNNNKISTNLKIDLERLNILFLRTLKRKLINRYRKGKLISPHLSEDLIRSTLTTTKKFIHIERSKKDPSKIVNYLGNFTSKIAITNKRILDYDGETVTFSYQDRSGDFEVKEMKIDAKLFLKRFMLHILPSRLTKIRYYGFMANNCKKLLSEIRTYLLEIANQAPEISQVVSTLKMLLDEILKPIKCPCCKEGIMEIKYSFYPTG